MILNDSQAAQMSMLSDPRRGSGWRVSGFLHLSRIRSPSFIEHLRYDYFLSHTWETPGHVKYLSLLILGRSCKMFSEPSVPLKRRKKHDFRPTLKPLEPRTYSSHRFLMICWVLAVALSWCLCLLELLPFFGHVNPEALRWRAPKPGCPTGPWIICAGS